MTKFCPECGSEQKDDAKFCSKCGVSFQSQLTSKEKIKKFKNTKLKNKKKIGIIAAVIIIIVIVAAVVVVSSINADKVTLSNIDASSYAMYGIDSVTYETDTSVVDYLYYVDADIIIDDSKKDVSQYSGKITFYEGDSEVKSVSGYIDEWEGEEFIYGDFSSKTLYNIDNVKIDIYNLDGKLVESVKSAFTMGDMANPI